MEKEDGSQWVCLDLKDLNRAVKREYCQLPTIKEFAEKWEFKHTTTSSKYPQANGQVEKAIERVKAVLKKAHEDSTDPYIALLKIRNTPITGLNYSPAQVFLNRRLNTKLPATTQLLDAQIATDARSQLLAQHQKMYFNKGAKSLPPS